jgi:hypothetical protein
LGTFAGGNYVKVSGKVYKQEGEKEDGNWDGREAEVETAAV